MDRFTDYILFEADRLGHLVFGYSSQRAPGILAEIKIAYLGLALSRSSAQSNLVYRDRNVDGFCPTRIILDG